MRLTAVQQLVEYEPGKPFSWLPEEVANASFYGKMIEDLGRHKSKKFTCEEKVVDKALRSPFFDDLEEIGGVYEIKEFM